MASSADIQFYPRHTENKDARKKLRDWRWELFMEEIGLYEDEKDYVQASNEQLEEEDDRQGRGCWARLPW